MLAAVLVALPASAQVAAPPPQGVAVLGTNGARDDAFALARAVYASGLRPRTLDELHARIMAGDALPPNALKDLRDLSELRASISGEDIASKRLLASIAQQLDLQGILVVSEKPAAAPVVTANDGGTNDTGDAGAPAATGDAGVPAATGTTPYARLFVAALGDFDAARYEPDPSWQATVASVSARFPPSPPAAPPTMIAGGPLPKVPTEKREDRPFYKSPWLWGALAAAAVIGGIFFFTSQDKSSDPIHVRMSVPH